MINMEIQIIEQMEDALKVLIQCRKADNEVLRLKTHIELLDATAPSGLFIVKNPNDRLSEQGKSPFRFRLAGLSESNALSVDRDVGLCGCTGKIVNGLRHDLRCPSSALWVVISVQKLLFPFSCHTNRRIDHRHLFFACCRGGFYVDNRNHFWYYTVLRI